MEYRDQALDDREIVKKVKVHSVHGAVEMYYLLKHPLFILIIGRNEH